MIRTILSVAFLSLAAKAAATTMEQDERDLGSSSTFVDLKITVTNIAYRQPMSPFFVAVHDENFPPLYKLGEPAPLNGIQALAEDGNPNELVDYYSSPQLSPHSSHVSIFAADDDSTPLLEGGESTSIIVRVSVDHRYVSLASMAVNTNDCFVGFSGMKLYPGMCFTVPGYDAGTEENNEDCSSIPGPACADIDPDNNEASGNGEGFVHVHRGVHGMFDDMPTDLAPEVYDWRNPPCTLR
eukprot:NODE_408_length_926_cov_102.246294_g357_i0.p1 GENE.NODE_408_length_926_cov_102.246294_g357_i0~~NODE_408_length_926_cov_102.246294_g357_i0.p1  ORF type:complete len:240 (-),score=58.30 NODE_408_length_926_cov_102.246294_g357_i0:3-722(-)